MMHSLFDLIVIGGGPAGYLGAQRAGDAGLSTLLIEKREVGGVCLNEGCIPSKTLLYSAKMYDNARLSEKYGVKSENVIFDHGKVMSRKNKVVRTLVAGVKSQLRNSKVTVINSFAEITGENSEGFEIKTNNGDYIGKRLLIATGSEPVIPTIPSVNAGLEDGYVLTNREILDIKEIPEDLVIVGGGVVGLEMASYFNSTGSRVTIIEMLDHIAGNNEKEISNLLMKNYERKGILFKLSSKVVEIINGQVIYEYKGAREAVKADKVLLSVGRKAVTDGYGLDKINVEVERGHIKVDERGQTNIPGVYAAGDVNGYSMLAHTAYREAEVCVNNMLGKKDIMRYNGVPYVIYTNPEVAGVGETEESAKEKGLDVAVNKISMRYSGRYLAENEGGDGICKILTDKKYGRLVGLHMIGNYASEIIYGAAAMIEMEMRIEDIKEIVFPHPTVSEIIREGIFQL